MTRGRDSGQRVAPPPHNLPQPPTDTERDSYLGPQRRWLPLASFIGYVLIAISIGFFMARHTWTLFLAVPLAVSAISTTLSLITTSRRPRVNRADHRARVDAWSPATFPSVDVFLPSAGEHLSVLENTYLYVSRLNWPGHLRVYVLDDSGRDEVRQLSRGRGFTYLSRPDRGRLKKAGNLLHGYDNSDGDLIAIFDADFVPRADFLHELVPYFDQLDVGIVQSPQFFDLDPTMNWLQRAAGATQVLFYRYVQPGRDASRAAICVGTSALYRRSALAAAGGFAQISHSEDVHTGVNVMDAGYQLRYVPTVVSKGECPDSFDGFVVQQYRWCGGSMALLMSGRFHEVRMTLMQRLCYWSGFTYYISTAVEVIVAAIPTVLMAYFFADRVRVQNYVFVMLALAVRQALIPYLTGGKDSLIGLARIQTTYSFAHLLRLWDVATRHEDTEGWVATGAAGRTQRAARVLRLARVWLIGNQVLLWTAILLRLPQYGIGRFWPMIAFGFFNLYITYPVITGRAQLPELQQAIRRAIETGSAKRTARA